MSKIIKLTVDDSLKEASDTLFSKLGLNTSTAIKIFLSKSVELGGFPFKTDLPTPSVLKAINDVLQQKNLSPAYTNSEDVIKAMLEED